MAIHFECPRCDAHHDRGYLDGVSLFRCLRCGYSGRGWHPDEDIDNSVVDDIRAGNAVNRSLGLPEDPLTPFVDCVPRKEGA